VIAEPIAELASPLALLIPLRWWMGYSTASPLSARLPRPDASRRMVMPAGAGA